MAGDGETHSPHPTGWQGVLHGLQIAVGLEAPGQPQAPRHLDTQAGVTPGPCRGARASPCRCWLSLPAWEPDGHHTARVGAPRRRPGLREAGRVPQWCRGLCGHCGTTACRRPTARWERPCSQEGAVGEALSCQALKDSRPPALAPSVGRWLQADESTRGGAAGWTRRPDTVREPRVRRLWDVTGGGS